MEITTTTITWCGQGVGVYISLAACPSLLISLPTLFTTLKYGKSTHWNLFILHVKSDFIHYNRPRICRNRISFNSQRVTRSCRRRVQLQRTNTTDLLHFLTTNLHEPVFSVVHIHKPPSPSSTFSYAINYCLVCSLFFTRPFTLHTHVYNKSAILGPRIPTGTIHCPAAMAKTTRGWPVQDGVEFQYVNCVALSVPGSDRKSYKLLFLSRYSSLYRTCVSCWERDQSDPRPKDSRQAETGREIWQNDS